MDTNSINQPPQPEGQPNESRLPAGSTLKVGDIQVPHPHAEPNLPGVADPRLGETQAVTEEVVHDGETSRVDSRPLDESVKPKVLTVQDSGPDARSTDGELEPVPEVDLTKTQISGTVAE